MSVFGLTFSYHVKDGPLGTLGMKSMSLAFERAGAEFARFGEHVFPLVIPALEKETGGQFRAQGRGPNRGRWAPLSPAYAKQKRRLYGANPILVATGSMRDALTKSGSGSAVRYYNSRELRFGTAGVTYASFHQTGTVRGLPDRPPFDFTKDFETALTVAAGAAARSALKDLNRFADYKAERGPGGG